MNPLDVLSKTAGGLRMLHSIAHAHVAADPTVLPKQFHTLNREVDGQLVRDGEHMFDKVKVTNAQVTWDLLTCGSLSWSRTFHRAFITQPRVRSTRQRLGRTTNPLAPLGDGPQGEVQEVVGPVDESARTGGIRPDLGGLRPAWAGEPKWDGSPDTSMCLRQGAC
ncbi:hypothetical protein ACFY3N_34790 [Streptomyces sp. NPDC000348]|uniref:hypothetical protein n=1 Tax=Streptomyces sp. NPDC000348 TaxID=3364538 RepID=UPI0036AFA413